MTQPEFTTQQGVTSVAPSVSLNERAQRLADYLASTAGAAKIAVRQATDRAKIIDCGIEVEGGVQAGLGMARVCLAGQAEVALVPGEVAGMPCPHVQVYSDQPVLACMASQYAGWQIAVDDFQAMGSGPMRAAYGKEELFDHIPGREEAPVAVGVLETGKIPTEAAVDYLAQSLKLPAGKITLLVAPASSIAGNLQVVARSLETALHKLHELNFDLKQVMSGFGAAPLAPVANKELTAIGRTNDAILYGGRVFLWVRADDDQIAEIGPKVPSSASPDHGAPFKEIFERYQFDFYKIDPMLFSPAQIVINNLATGRSQVFGGVEPDILYRSFFG